jgi:hypothetical protein
VNDTREIADAVRDALKLRQELTCKHAAIVGEEPDHQEILLTEFRFEKT